MIGDEDFISKDVQVFANVFRLNVADVYRRFWWKQIEIMLYLNYIFLWRVISDKSNDAIWKFEAKCQILKKTKKS